jgi:hypothetical protein
VNGRARARESDTLDENRSNSSGGSQRRCVERAARCGPASKGIIDPRQAARHSRSAVLTFYCRVSSECHFYLRVCDRGFIRRRRGPAGEYFSLPSWRLISLIFTVKPPVPLREAGGEGRRDDEATASKNNVYTLPLRLARLRGMRVMERSGWLRVGCKGERQSFPFAKVGCARTGK